VSGSESSHLCGYVHALWTSLATKQFGVRKTKMQTPATFARTLGFDSPTVTETKWSVECHRLAWLTAEW